MRLSARHRPLCAAHGCGLAVATVAGMPVGHGPLRAARSRGRGRAVAAGLRWTCGPDSSAGGQRQTAYSWRRRSQQP